MIVNKFEGKIDFISEYNKGSTFFFSIMTESIKPRDIKLYNRDKIETL